MQSCLDASSSRDFSVVIASKAKAYGICRAKRAGIPVEVLPLELQKKENREKAEQWILDVLARYNCRELFLAGFMRILSQTFIDRFKGRILNIHPSLLPKYKGAHALKEALSAGEKVIGVTVHEVSADVDSGDILIQRKFDVPGPHSELTELWLHIQEQRVIRHAFRSSAIQFKGGTEE